MIGGLLPVLLAVLLAASTLEARQNESSGTIRGVVVDAATGAPLSRVLVVDQESGLSTTTGSEGLFELVVPAGTRRLRASVVGYSVAERHVTVAPGGAVEVTIPLAGGTGYSESVTVSADRFRTADPGAPAQQVLGSADIQNLRGVLADDPLRAVQVLPGVATGDDLRSEFSVRGSNFSHMHLTLDGFTTPYLLHAIRAVEDESSSGSVAMINSDILQDVSLVSGGYVQRSGNRTGASVEFNVRSGSRERTQWRAAVSGTGVSLVVEGPLKAKRGSWLVSARQSYLDLVIDRLVDDQVKFGFSDAQAKVVYDLSPSQRLQLTVLAGRSRLKEPEEQVGGNDLYLGLNASAIGIGRWQWSGARTVLGAGVMGGVNRFRNETIGGTDLDNGREQQISGRFDARHQLTGAIELEAGGEVDAASRVAPAAAPCHRDHLSRRQRLFRRRYPPGCLRIGPLGSDPLAQFPAGRARGSFDTHRRHDRLTLAASGVARLAEHIDSRGDRRLPAVPRVRASDRRLGNPWARFRASHSSRRGRGTGHRPVGARAGDDLRPRRERFLRRAGAETRLVAGRLVPASRTGRYENRVEGSSRGIEMMLQRLDANGFSGWVSYSYGRNRLPRLGQR